MRRIIASIDRYSLALLGCVIMASLLPVRGAGAATLDWIAAAAITLLFFLHGAKLSSAAILQGVLAWRLHLVVLCFTFVLFPVIGIGAQALASPVLAPGLASGLLFLTLVPSTVQSSIAFTAIARGNVPAAICAASASNLLGIALTPILVGLLMTGSGGDLSAEGAKTIVFQLLLPFIAGHLARPLVGGFVARHPMLVSLVDRGSILLIVYAAFSAAVVEGLWRKAPLWQIGLLVLFAVLVLAIVLAATRFTARLLGFAPADEAVIVFCGSKKSLASGVPIAGALFPAAMVGAIILPLMIFHQLQLFACALIAQRMQRRADATATTSGRS